MLIFHRDSISVLFHVTSLNLALVLCVSLRTGYLEQIHVKKVEKKVQRQNNIWIQKKTRQPSLGDLRKKVVKKWDE